MDDDDDYMINRRKKKGKCVLILSDYKEKRCNVEGLNYLLLLLKAEIYTN